MNEEFTGHLEDTIINEISLEGLEGITLEGLWTRLADALKINLPLRTFICAQVWNFILNLPRHFQFFILPEPRPALVSMDRMKFINSELTGEKIDECPSRDYKYNQIEDNSIRGSCEYYKERAEIGVADIADKTLDEINEKWGNTFIIVATQHLREQALIQDTHVPSLPSELKIQPYCFLERIGRSRYFGEATIGKHSLLNMSSESVVIFYIRNRLANLNLIRKQSYYERSQAGSLLHLPRFCTAHQPVQIAALADAIKYLREHNGVAEHAKLRAYLSRNHDISIKKFAKTTMFKKYIVSSTVLYREVYPDATTAEYMKKSHKNQEKVLKVLKLANANVKLDDICEDEEAEDEETTKAFLFKDNLYLDVPMTEQIYEAVKSYGPAGISQTALTKYFGCRKLCMRRFIKKMLFVGLLGFYVKDEGRQRLRIYVARKFLHSNNKDGVPETETLDEKPTELDLKILAEESKTEKPPEYELLTPMKKEEPVKCLEIADKNEPDFKMKIMEFNDSSGTKRSQDCLTVKQKSRRDIVLSITRKSSMVDVNEIIRAILESEQNLGYTDKICRKSMSRILLPLVEQNLIKLFDIRMQWREYVKAIRLVCAANLNLEQKPLIDELLRLKECFFSTITMKRHKSHKKASMLSLKAIRQKKQHTTAPKPSGDRVGSAKYVRAKLVHELLFQLVYALKPNQKPIPYPDIASAWKEYDLAIDASELRSEMPNVYNTDVNWTMFLNPLPAYENYPPGWICLKDFLLRIPLPLFIKIHRFDDNINELLAEYLKHPVKKYYTIWSLPLEIRDLINFDKSYVRTIEDILRLLGHMGLIQLGPRSHRASVHNFIYVNKNALLLDTTLSDASYSKVSDDRDYPELRFTFSTAASVTEFWLTLQNICMTTKLGFRHKRDKQEKPSKYILSNLPEVPIEEAPKKDIGYLIGGRGAAGLDWKLFAHKTRNWDLSFRANTKRIDPTKPRPKARYSTIKLPQVRQVVYKRYKKNLVVKRIKKICYDDIDKECLQRMEQLRCRWNEKEDRLLLICRVAHDFLQGNSGQKTTTAFVCRDILQWHLGSMQKSSLACQRRIRYLLRSKSNVNTVNSWLNELYQNEYMRRTYSPQFLVELRKLYPSVNSFMAVTRVYFIQVVCFLIQLLNKTTLSTADFIPDTLEQFGLLFRKSLDNSSVIRHFDPTTVDQVEESTINLLIHSSVCSKRDKMLYNIQLFEIYRSYDEGMIEKCFRKVRVTDQLVVTGKIVSKQKFPLLGKKVCISNMYRQQFFVLIPYAIFDQCHESLKTLLADSFGSGEKGQVKYTCVNSGTSILIAELASIAGVCFDIQIPKQVLKFDPTQMQNSLHAPDRIIDHFNHFLVSEKKPLAEYTKEIAAQSSTAQPRKVQFNINISIHRVISNPYDVISRLSEAHMHFFCALQHLGSSVDIGNLMQNSFHCPFRCLLQDEDYLNTISNLLRDNEQLIKELAQEQKTSTALQDYDDDAFMESTVSLSRTNIVLVANHVRDFILRISDENQKKDLGGLRVQQRRVDVVRLAHDALDARFETEDHISDEEDLLMERGDGNPRYQDFLVVNTPTLSIDFGSESGEMVSYKNMLVPNKFLPSLDKKQEVLDRAIEDSLWKFTQTSLEELEGIMVSEGFSEQERNYTKQVLNFIELSDIGVKASELVGNFVNRKTLLKSLSILRKFGFIKRVGVGSLMFVHRMKIKPWLINSFHVKRLDQEAMTPQSEVTLQAIEQMHSKQETEDCDEPMAKKIKLEETGHSSRSKRNIKPVLRFTSEDSAGKGLAALTEKVRVNLRPAPWIRVNGTLNRRVFDRWLGTVLLEATVRCSAPVKHFYTRFYHLHPVNVLFLLENLQDLGCVQLKCAISEPVTIFTEEDEVVVADADELTNSDNMFVISKPKALLIMALFIGDKKYQIDF